MSVEYAQQRFQDYADYHRYFRIIDREARTTVPLTLRREQVRLYNQIVAADQAAKPARFVILKARQIGYSTLIQSIFAHRALTRRNFHALTVSHEDESTALLHGMVERIYDHLPPALRVAKDTKERGKRLYLQNGSQLRVQTAGGDGDVGRSSGASALHLSEAAHYLKPEATALSAFNLVQDSPGTLVIVESTANGAGNWFEREWWRAVNDESGYTPVFSPWFADPDYQRPDLVPPGGFDELDAEELELRAQHGVTDPQLAWRRHTLKQPAYGGDVDRFHQEMPSDPAEAFLASGRPYFGSLVRRMIPTPPVKRGDFDVTGRQVRFVEDESVKAPCFIWELRQPDRRYVVTLDPAGKVTDREASEFASMRDSEDYSVITVTDCMTGAEVCTWRDRRDPSLVAKVLAGIGAVYNRALISVENTGGYGGVALDRLQEMGYQNLHRERRYDSVRKRVSLELGHDTTETTRARVLEALRDVLRDSPHLLRDERLKAEMRVFVHGRTGKPEAQPGHHDDLVMARAWGVHLSRVHAQAVPRRVGVKPKSNRELVRAA